MRTIPPTTWHALYVGTRCERKVAGQLAELGFEVCLPVQWQIRQWTDRKKRIEVVLFPNYVFLATDIEHQNHPLQLPNVHRYISFGGKIACLSEKEVELIKKIGDLEFPVEISSGSLAAGDEVEIIAGTLKHNRGRILAINGTARVQLAIPGLQCFAQVTVRREEVRKL